MKPKPSVVHHSLMQAVLLWPHTAQVHTTGKTSADGIPVLDAEQRAAHPQGGVAGEFSLGLHIGTFKHCVFETPVLGEILLWSKINFSP